MIYTFAIIKICNLNLSENWLQDIRDGNKDMLTSLYHNLLPKIYDWVIKNKGESKLAKDLFHESLSDLILSDSNPDINNPEAYIFQMCKFKFYRLRQKNSKIEYVDVYNDDLSGNVHSFEDLENERIKFQIMDRTFSELSELCQKIINLIKQGNKPEQIATILDMNNANTVNRRKFACMASWIEKVKNDKMYYTLK
jgi:DNA-directed RNA polymerase specialized sigma24 family protein